MCSQYASLRSTPPILQPINPCPICGAAEAGNGGLAAMKLARPALVGAMSRPGAPVLAVIAGPSVAMPTAELGDAEGGGAPPVGEERRAAHGSDPQHGAGPRAGPSDRVDAVRLLHVEDRRLGDRSVTAVERQHVALVEQGDLQRPDVVVRSRRVRSGRPRARGRRGCTARRSAWWCRPSCRAGSGARRSPR